MRPISWRFAAVLLLSLCGSLAWADETPFVITPETRPRGLELGPNEQIFEDVGGKLTFDQVRTLSPENLVPFEKLGKPNYHNAYWVRVAVRSELALDMQYLVFAGGWWDFLDIFVVHPDGSVTAMRSGLLKTPAGADDKFYPSFLIRPGQTLTLFVRFTSVGMFHAPQPPVIVLAQAASRHEVVQAYLYFQGIIVGMLFALALYNFIIALSTRDTAYFLYSIYLFALAFSLVGQMGASASNLNQYFLPNHPWVAMWIKRLSDPLAWVMLLLFDRAFLETRRYLPAWDKALIATIIIYAASELFGFFGPTREALPAEDWVGYEAIWYVIASLGIVAGVLRYRQGFVPAKYFVTAQSLLSFGLLTLGQQDKLWNPLHYLPDAVFWRYVKGDPLWIGAAAEAILFSMGLAYRMNELKAKVAQQALAAEQDRRRLAIEHNERLEVEVAERTQELRLEKENANNLLHNILPVEVADELIANGSTRPQRYKEATILFTDFRDFTKTVASLPANQVVEELNDIFQHFDDIIDACGIEKIKTIGDAYMIAGGLPKPMLDHAERCVDAALRMQAYLKERNETAAVKWNMRAGIHSGEVVAGVVGKKKFTYDVWGDTVNTASRMESAGEAGRVNISASTYDLIKSRYKSEYRGKLDAKGKGEIDMYFVTA